MMKIKRKLLPGQAGTKSLLKKYGDDLICVRYRYDETQMVALKTVELIVEKTAWRKKPKKADNNKRIVNIRVDYGEIELGKKVREAGGKWNRAKRVWELPFSEVVALNLESRIIGNR